MLKPDYCHRTAAFLTLMSLLSIPFVCLDLPAASGDIVWEWPVANDGYKSRIEFSHGTASLLEYRRLKINVYGLANGELETTIDAASYALPHNGINYLSLSPDGKLIALAYRIDGFQKLPYLMIDVRELSSDSILWSARIEAWQTNRDEYYWNAKSLATWSPDGKTLLAGAYAEWLHPHAQAIEGQTRLFSASGDLDPAAEIDVGAVEYLHFDRSGRYLWADGHKGYGTTPPRSYGSYRGTCHYVVYDLERNEIALNRKEDLMTQTSSLAFSADGRFAVRGTDDGQIELYGLHTESVLRSTIARRQKLLALQFNDKIDRIAGVNAGGQAWFWTTNELEPVYALALPFGDLRQAVFSPGGEFLAVETTDKRLLLLDWNMAEFDHHGLRLRHAIRPERLRVGDIQLSYSGDTVMTPASGVSFLDAADGNVLLSMRSTYENVIHALLAPNNAYVAQLELSPVWQGNETLRLWDVENYDNHVLSSEFVPGGNICFSSDAALLLSSHYRNSQTLAGWNLADRSLAFSYSIASRVDDIRLSADDSMLYVLSQGKILILNIENGEELATEEFSSKASELFVDAADRFFIGAVHINQNSSVDEIIILDRSTGRQRVIASTAENVIIDCALVADETKLIVLSRLPAPQHNIGRVAIYDLESDRLIDEFRFPGIKAPISVSGDGSTFCIMSYDESKLFFFDIAD